MNTHANLWQLIETENTNLKTNLSENHGRIQIQVRRYNRQTEEGYLKQSFVRPRLLTINHITTKNHIPPKTLKLPKDINPGPSPNRVVTDCDLHHIKRPNKIRKTNTYPLFTLSSSKAYPIIHCYYSWLFFRVLQYSSGWFCGY